MILEDTTCISTNSRFWCFAAAHHTLESWHRTPTTHLHQKGYQCSSLNERSSLRSALMFSLMKMSRGCAVCGVMTQARRPCNSALLCPCSFYDVWTYLHVDPRLLHFSYSCSPVLPIHSIFAGFPPRARCWRVHEKVAFRGVLVHLEHRLLNLPFVVKS